MVLYGWSALSRHLVISTWFASMLSTVSRADGRSSFEEKSSTTYRSIQVSVMVGMPKTEQQTLLSRPFIPDMPRDSWNEWILILAVYNIVLNSSWILSNTSFISSCVSTIASFESSSANRARFDVISPHSPDKLLRCGVPRKIMAFVRKRHQSDLYSAYRPPSV